MRHDLVVTGSIANLARGTSPAALAESFLSAEVLCLADVSGSMSAADAPGDMQRYDAADLEYKRLQKQYPGKVFIVAFSDTVIPCFGGLPWRLDGGTDMAKALEFALPADGVCKIVLVSDGSPNSEQATLEMARKFKHPISTVFIGPEDDRRGRDFLRRLASATGGQSSQAKAPGLLGDGVERLLLEAKTNG